MRSTNFNLGDTMLSERCHTLTNALGTTASEIAKALMKLGIKGQPGIKSQCPLARYIKSQIGETVYVSDNSPDCPPPLAEFIQNFDQGKYPELVEETHMNIQSVYDVQWFRDEILRDIERCEPSGAIVIQKTLWDILTSNVSRDHNTPYASTKILDRAKEHGVQIIVQAGP